MIDRIKDILKAELSDKLHQFTNFKSLEELEIDEILNRLKKEHSSKSSTQEDTQQEQSYEYQQNSTYTDSKIEKEKAYYKALELPDGSDFDTIKKKYRKLMKLYHPDLYVNDKEKFDMAKDVSQQLNEAYVYFKNKYEK